MQRQFSVLRLSTMEVPQSQFLISSSDDKFRRPRAENSGSASDAVLDNDKSHLEDSAGAAFAVHQ